MRAVGIKVLKDRLSEYVKLAASGETVLVTDRDRVVAELGPPAPGRSVVLSDAQLAEAVRKGWLVAPIRSGVVPPRQPALTMAELLAGIDRDREDR